MLSARTFRVAAAAHLHNYRAFREDVERFHTFRDQTGHRTASREGNELIREGDMSPLETKFVVYVLIS